MNLEKGINRIGYICGLFWSIGCILGVIIYLNVAPGITCKQQASLLSSWFVLSIIGFILFVIAGKSLTFIVRGFRDEKGE